MYFDYLGHITRMNWNVGSEYVNKRKALPTDVSELAKNMIRDTEKSKNKIHRNQSDFRKKERNNIDFREW